MIPTKKPWEIFFDEYREYLMKDLYISEEVRKKRIQMLEQFREMLLETL